MHNPAWQAASDSGTARAEVLLARCWLVIARELLPRMPGVFEKTLIAARRTRDTGPFGDDTVPLPRKDVLVEAYSSQLRGHFDVASARFLGYAGDGPGPATGSVPRRLRDAPLEARLEEAARRLGRSLAAPEAALRKRLASLWPAGAMAGAFSGASYPLRPALFLEAAADAVSASSQTADGVTALLQHFPLALSVPLADAYRSAVRVLDGHALPPGRPVPVPGRTNPTRRLSLDSHLTLISAGGAGRDSGVSFEQQALAAYVRLQTRLGVDATALMVAMDAVRLAPELAARPPVPLGADLAQALQAARRDDAVRIAAGLAAEAASGPVAADTSDPERFARLAAAAANPLQRQTIGLVSQLFGRIARDRIVPPALLAQLLHLRFPFLELVLAEPAMLLRADHPAARLINVIATSAIGWKPEGKEGQRHLSQVRAAVHLLVHSPVTGATAFAQACEQFDAYLAAIVPHADPRVAAAREVLREAEKRAENRELPAEGREQAIADMLARPDVNVAHQWPREPQVLDDGALDLEQAGGLVQQWRDRTWFDLRVGRTYVRMRLLGWTPGRTLALFSSRSGASLASLSHETAVAYLRAGYIAPVEKTPLLARALRGVLKDLRQAIDLASAGPAGAERGAPPAG